MARHTTTQRMAAISAQNAERDRARSVEETRARLLVRLERAQSPAGRAALQSAFDASPAALGAAAVRTAKREAAARRRR